MFDNAHAHTMYVIYVLCGYFTWCAGATDRSENVLYVRDPTTFDWMCNVLFSSARRRWQSFRPLLPRFPTAPSHRHFRTNFLAAPQSRLTIGRDSMRAVTFLHAAPPIVSYIYIYIILIFIYIRE